MACLVFFINSLDISGCRGVTFPVDESNEEVTERLREKIKNGEYTTGELIVPQRFIKTTLCGNRIEKEEVEISGRKIDITYIRKKLLKKMKNSCEKDLMKYLITWTGKVLLRTYKSSMRFKVAF